MLEKRSEEEKKSFEGRKEYVYFLQCKENIDPFFTMLRDNVLTFFIL